MIGKEKKTLTLKLKVTVNATSKAETTQPASIAPTPVEDESNLTRRSGMKRRLVRREDIPSEKLTIARPPRNPPRPMPQKELPPLTPAEQQAVDLTEKLMDSSSTWARYQPLAIGIQDQLKDYFVSIDMATSKRVLHRVLWHHTHQREYLEQIITASHRCLLDGTPSGEIKDSERDHARRAIAVLDEEDAQRRAAANQARQRPRHR